MGRMKIATAAMRGEAAVGHTYVDARAQMWRIVECWGVFEDPLEPLSARSDLSKNRIGAVETLGVIRIVPLDGERILKPAWGKRWPVVLVVRVKGADGSFVESAPFIGVRAVRLASWLGRILPWSPARVPSGLLLGIKGRPFDAGVGEAWLSRIGLQFSKLGVEKRRALADLGCDLIAFHNPSVDDRAGGAPFVEPASKG